MSKIRLDAGKATAEDPFVASFLDMFFAHVTNSPAAALAILDAQDAGTPPETSIKDVVKGVMTAEELSALFKAREKAFRLAHGLLRHRSQSEHAEIGCRRRGRYAQEAACRRFGAELKSTGRK